MLLSMARRLTTLPHWTERTLVSYRLPDELVRRVKVTAAVEGRTCADVVAEALRALPARERR